MCEFLRALLQHTMVIRVCDKESIASAKLTRVNAPTTAHFGGHLCFGAGDRHALPTYPWMAIVTQNAGNQPAKFRKSIYKHAPLREPGWKRRFAWEPSNLSHVQHRLSICLPKASGAE